MRIIFTKSVSSLIPTGFLYSLERQTDAPSFLEDDYWIRIQDIATVVASVVQEQVGFQKDIH